MAKLRRRPEEFELLPVDDNISESDDESARDEHDALASTLQRGIRDTTFLGQVAQQLSRTLHHVLRQFRFSSRRHGKRPSSLARRWLALRVAVVLCFLLILPILFVAIFRPSYTHLPQHYLTLRKACNKHSSAGCANINNEKVFIAATLYDAGGKLVGGQWGTAVQELINLLGPDNVHLSIYQNDPDAEAEAAMQSLKQRLSCATSLISEHLALDDLPHILLPSGEQAVKRMALLSEVRNRALRPLQQPSSPKFDKLLYLNDVIFNPIDAAHLLFSTNIDATTGRAQYAAACAFDFVNPFKFYDRFATRDLEGYETGIPFYPWFTNAGQGTSRKDVLRQSDAVRVRSCWGGMVAFEAKWFQTNQVPNNARRLLLESDVLSKDGDLGETAHEGGMSPLQFRYEPTLFWDASECCLIHADLTLRRSSNANGQSSGSSHGDDGLLDTGIYANPYVRVAYDSTTLSWLPFIRRFERLYSLVHNVLNHLVGLPRHNPRRLMQPGETVVEDVWQYDGDDGDQNEGQPSSTRRPHGSYRKIKSVAEPGRFCGSRTLQIINEHPKPGDKKFIIVEPP